MRNSAFRQAGAIAVALLGMTAAEAAPVPYTLLGIGSLTGSTDLSVGTSGLLENGVDQGNVLGGIGSGLAYAGGNTFLALPDRGPNATTYAAGAGIDSTTSYISRFQTLTLSLSNIPSGSLPWTVTPTLTGTTLLYSPTALAYGSASGSLPDGTPALNSPGVNYFTGRSDGFGAGSSTNPNNGRLDPEGIRVSNDGKYVYVSDEYGPYVYQFDRATGERTKTFTLPAAYAAANLNGLGATEISGNTTGRVANKGMEGLAISPDGSTLIGFEQSPLIQDGGDGGRANRIVKIDVATGAVKEYVYDNYIASANKNYNSSEILALNDHEFLVLERDGKGLGDGSKAVVKKIFRIDLNGATDISTLGISGEANLLPYAVAKDEFLDLKAALVAAGIPDTQIPAKLEGMAFGEDVVFNSIVYHTLIVANDNDFVPGVAGPNNFYVFGIKATDLPTFQAQAVVPIPAAAVLFPSALGLLGWVRRRKPA